MSPQRVNYDTIAHLYDEPLRNHDVDHHLIAYLAERPPPDQEQYHYLVARFFQLIARKPIGE